MENLVYLVSAIQDVLAFLYALVAGFGPWFRAYVVPPMAIAVGIVVALCVIGWAFNYKPSNEEQKGPWAL